MTDDQDQTAEAPISFGNVRGHQVTIRGGTDIISFEDFQAYFEVIHSAFAVHIDRETIRQGLWKDYPAEDQFNQIKIKIDRVTRSIERIAELKKQMAEQPSSEVHGICADQLVALKRNIKEELYDIINYANFGERQL